MNLSKVAATSKKKSVGIVQPDDGAYNSLVAQMRRELERFDRGLRRIRKLLDDRSSPKF